ncbi:MAG: hypothetical protein GEV11_08985, partial [Streptosporangiales bacterium]|nr:hypothetical protein [Streptosporangiales bacterium]
MIVTSAALVVMAIAMLIWGIVAEQLTAVYASVGVSVVSAVLLAVGVFLRRRELFGDAARSGAATVPNGAAAAVGTAGLGKTAVPVGGAPHGARRDTAVRDTTSLRGTGARGTGARDTGARDADRRDAGPRDSGPRGAGSGGTRRRGANSGGMGSGGTGPGVGPGDRASAPGRATAPATRGDDDEGETYPVPTGLDVPLDAIVHVVPGRRRYHLGSCRQLRGRQSEELTYEEAHEEGFSACTACMPDIALAARGPRTAQPTPAPVTPQNSTWDGQSVRPDTGGGEPADTPTITPQNSTWDGQSVKPDEAEDADTDTISPQNSTWDGQSVKPGAGKAADVADAADDSTAESAVAGTRSAEEKAAARTDEPMGPAAA